MSASVNSSSPGKENAVMRRMESKPELMSDLTGLIASPKTKEDLDQNSRIISKRINETDFTAMGVIFEPLGPSKFIINAIKINLELTFTLFRKHEDTISNGYSNFMEELSVVDSLANSIKTLFNCTKIVFEKIPNGCKINESLGYITPSLADFLIYSARMKSSKIDISELVDLCCQILKLMQTGMAEPYFLTLVTTAKFLDACFKSSSTKIRTAAIGMWNSTFAKAKELDYPDYLKETLVNVRKKSNIYLPGIELDTVLSKSDVALQIRPKKRVMALGDEDSQVYVPITESAKKMKLTEHQKELFATPREKMPFYNEDSNMFEGNVLAGIKTQFDIDTSMSASTSIEKKAQNGPQEDKLTSIILDTSSAKVQEEPNQPAQEQTEKESKASVPAKEVENNATNKGEEVESAPVEVKRKRGRPSKKSLEAKKMTAPSTPKSEIKEKVTKTRRSITEKKDAEDNVEPATNRRSIRSRSQIEETTPIKNKREIEEEKEIKKEANEEQTVESAKDEEAPAQSDNSQDCTEVRSRRSQAKGTPSKYIPKERMPRSAKGKTGVNQTEETKRKPLKNSVVKNKPSETVEMPVEESVKDPIVEPIKIEETPEPVEEIKVPEIIEKVVIETNVPMDGMEMIIPLEEREKELAGEKNEAPQGTPSKIVNAANSPASILRHSKTLTPKNHLHVHFSIGEEVDEKINKPKIFINSSRNILESTQNTHSPLSQYSTEPLCLALVENKTPITEILDQIIINSSTGPHKLRKQLASLKIATIGDLATTSERILRLYKLPLGPISKVKEILEGYLQNKAKKAADKGQIEKEKDLMKFVDIEEDKITDKSPSRQRFCNVLNEENAVLKPIDLSPIRRNPVEEKSPIKPASPTPIVEGVSKTNPSLVECNSCLAAAHCMITHTTTKLSGDLINLSKEQLKDILNKCQEMTSSLVTLQANITKLI